MVKIAGRTFTWKMVGLTFAVFCVVWLTIAGLLATRQRVRVHPVNFSSGSALILVVPNPATKVTGHGGCVQASGRFATEALSVENSRAAAAVAYATRNQCLTFPDETVRSPGRSGHHASGGSPTSITSEATSTERQLAHRSITISLTTYDDVGSPVNLVVSVHRIPGQRT